MRPWTFFSLLLVFFIIPKGYGYSLGDHEQLTRAATSSLARCFPSTFSESEVRALVDANLWEDQNVLRKWFGFSHFYHPEHHFRSARLTSRDRILNLEAQLSRVGAREARDELVGKALHHIQDMTVPPHVVPVNHFWTDGFEDFDLPIVATFRFDSCDALLDEAARITPSDLHQMLAEETWQAVIHGAIPATRISTQGRRRMSLPLIAFWSPGSEEDWGSYGVFGNAYGKGRLEAQIGTFEVGESSYSAFKQGRLQSALRASQLMLTRLLVLGI